jgi:hypothetical protein
VIKIEFEFLFIFLVKLEQIFVCESIWLWIIIH